MPDSHPASEDFLRLFMRHELQIRAFIRACLPRASDVDEVMQEDSLVAWKKFASLSDHSQFVSWLCLIARYEILKYCRKFARDRLVLDDAMVALVAAEADSELPLRGRQFAALEDCVERLSEERRQLLKTAYSSGQTVRALAEQWGRTENSLYKTLVRIRLDLLQCINHKLEAQA